MMSQNLPMALTKLTNMSNFIKMRFWYVPKSKFDLIDSIESIELN